MADIIDKAIENGWNKSVLGSQTWEQFESDLVHKQLVIYGIGIGAELFLKHYADKYRLAGAIDATKYGELLFEYDFRTGKTDTSDIYIEKPACLDHYMPKRTIVLIAALKHHVEIYQSLKSKGFSYIYSFLCMEVNKRIKLSDYTEYSDPREEYVLYKMQSPSDYNNVFVETMSGYSGHARYIVEAMKKKNNDLCFTWYNESNTPYPDIGLKEVKRNTRSYYDALYKAGLWLFEDPVFYETKKKQDQILIQLKHWSSITLKTFGIKLEEPLEQKFNSLPGSYRRHFEHNAELTDYVITGSDFDEQTVRDNYLYKGSFFRAGSPRSDILFDAERFRISIRAKYGIEADTKICLYVPTFRFDDKRRCRYKETGIQFLALRDSLEKSTGEDWIIMIRLHPRTDRDTIPLFPDYVVDATDYMDGEELVAASDAVIADYSSIMFEPAFVGKPVFLYAPDIEEYLTNERGFLIPYEKLPFPRAYSSAGLIENILNFDQEKYEADVTAFLDKYGVHEDGHASERAADFILGLLDSKDKL